MQPEPTFHRGEHDTFAVRIDDRLMIDLLVGLDAIADHVMPERVRKARR